MVIALQFPGASILVQNCFRKGPKMAKSALTKGLVAGKSGPVLAGGMTVNPAIDKSNSSRNAARGLEIHAAQGVKALPPRTGAARMSNGANGQKVSGGGRLKGGRF